MFKIVRILSVPESIKTLSKGETVEVQCKDFAAWPTVVSAVARANNKSRERGDGDMFEIKGLNNNTSFKLTRLT